LSLLIDGAGMTDISSTHADAVATAANTGNSYTAERLRMLPPIRRARAYRLYTSALRLVDLWLDGGRALIGHTPSGITREIKNTAERGLFAGYPGYMERRALKALGRLFPGKQFRIYNEHTFRPFADTVPRWRPFDAVNAAECGGDDAGGAPYFTPVLPHPLCPPVLVINADSVHAAQFPDSDVLSPVRLTALSMSCTALPAAKSRAAVCYPKVERALEHSCIWQRSGSIYLRLSEKMDEVRYTALFKRFLLDGFLLPVPMDDPLILPGEMSDGESAKLSRLLGS
jgi:hypothetical protein